MKTLLKNITSFSSAIKVTLMVTVALAPFSAAASSVKEKSYNQLQAELLLNFIERVEWPEEQVPQKNICIMEDNPVIPYFKILLQNNKQNIVIVRKNENDYLEDCSVLFVNEYYDGYIDRLLSKVIGKPILTFSNIKNFAKKGGIAQFTLRNNRVDFILNIRQLKASQLQISQEILSISDTIN